MSRRELLVQRREIGLAAAMLDGGRLEEIEIDRDDLPKVGSLYLGKVGRIVPAMRAAFIDLGEAGTGLLKQSHIRPRPADGAEIGSLLRPGETVLVQIRAVMPEDKAPALSMEVTLPGRLLVHAPLGRRVSVSRRIADSAERARFAAMEGLGDGGWIVRAKAATAPADALQAEAAVLARDWAAVTRKVGDSTAPIRLADGPNAALRLLIESPLTPDRIEVAAAAGRQSLIPWLESHAPDLLPRLSEEQAADPFGQRDLDDRIEALLRPRVELPGGGALSIEPTTALTAVDVDTGGRAGPLQANLEAAAEIPRQLRLRHIGGIVVIDFVTLRQERERKAMLAALSAALSKDAVPTHLYGMTALGLVELTRERRAPTLSQLLRPDPDRHP